MARVAVVAGHLRSENLTLEGLCPAIKNDETVRRLRASTGSRGEREYSGDVAQSIADALRAAGVDARAIDSTYDKDTYETWAPDGVLAIHYHRDPRGRAMFAVPDAGLGFNTAQAQFESVRLEQRIENAWEAVVGIPLTDDLVTLNMTQLYTWCYIPPSAWAVIAELGNANIDFPALYSLDGKSKIVRYLRDCVLEHLNIVPPSTPPPARRVNDASPPPRAGATTEKIAASLEGLAKQVRELPN